MAPEKRLLSANMLLVRIADADLTYPLKKVSTPKQLLMLAVLPSPIS